MNIFKRHVRWFPLFTVGAAMTLVGMVGTATADGVTGHVAAWSVGVDPIHVTGRSGFTGLLPLSVDGGGTLQTYCIDLGTNTGVGVQYEEGTWNAASVPNLGYVLWVLEHGYPTVAAGAVAPGVTLTDSEAAAATQAAIWHFSDSADLLANNPANVIDAYQYLITHAQNLPEPGPGATVSITPPAASGTVGQLVGPFTVVTTAASVALSIAGDGVISAGVPSPIDVSNVHNGDTFFVKVLSAGSVTVTATATTTVLSGRVFLRTGSGEAKQKLITASNTTTQATATASVSATNATTTTTIAPTTTTTAPTTTTTAPTTTSTTIVPTTTSTTSVPTTTTEVGSEGPTTTVAATTTMVAVAGPTLPPDIELPATGQSAGRTQSALLLGTGLALMGCALMLATRRRTV